MTWSATSSAATLLVRLNGERLVINGPCAASVEIGPASGNGIPVHAAAHHAEELANLHLATENGAVVIRRRDPAVGCWRPAHAADRSATLSLAVLVPRATPIAIEDGGATDYRIPGVDGPLAVSLAGAATLRTDGTASVDGRLAGTNHLVVKRVSGKSVALEMSGRSVVALDALAAETVRIRSSGSVTIGPGRIGALSIMSTGDGSYVVAGTVANGSVSLIGGGAVRLARVTGTLSRQVIGSGVVTVDERGPGVER